MSALRVRRIIGLMSGTSCDGVDAAWVEVRGQGLQMKVKFLAHRHHPYPKGLQRRLLAVMAPAETTTEELCELNALVGEAFGAAALEVMGQTCGCLPAADLIGSHGQTVCHLPPVLPRRHRRTRDGSPGSRSTGSTLQLGDPAVIAARTGVPVVSNFREADVALGGQGAPLVPWTDYVLFRDPHRSRVIQNIGGIANLTYLPAGGAPEDVIAFDTGPGNMIIDELVRRMTGGRRSYDRDGRIASEGHVDRGWVRRWMKAPFFRKRPPKSCGREQFGAAFVDRTVTARDISNRGKDLVASATALTARTIADAYERFLPTGPEGPQIDEVILCGGGAKNTTLSRALTVELRNIPVLNVDVLGIPGQAKEAVSFAMLAAACVDRVPANLPRVTGASRPAILGRVTPA